MFKFEKEMKNPLKKREKQHVNKRPNTSSSSIFNFFATKEPFMKNEFFWGGLRTFNCEKPSSFVICEKYFNMHLCPRLVFPSNYFFSHELLHGLMEKLNNCTFCQL